jgi:hypothetical protein
MRLRAKALWMIEKSHGNVDFIGKTLIEVAD